MERRPEEPGEAWEIVGSEYVVQDRWLTLRADDCRNAAGRRIAPYYVLEYPDWVSVVALTVERDVVLIKQYRHGLRRTILELPGGAVDEQDASGMAAARRELLEETGFVAEEWRQTGTIGASPHNHTNSLHCFLAFNARYSAEPQREPSEQIEVLIVPLDEFLERAYQGELEHSHHVASLFFALRALGRG